MSAPTAQRSPIVRKLLREPTVDGDTAREFLGIRRDLSFRLMERYRRRIAKQLAAGKPLDEEAVRPRRGPDGSWAEIPNHKVGGRLRCRSDLLLEMTYPERRAEP